jgi:hypothetical protein
METMLLRRCAIAVLGVLALVAGAVGVVGPRPFRSAGGDQEVNESAAGHRAASRAAKPAGALRGQADSIASGGDHHAVVDHAGERTLAMACVLVAPPALRGLTGAPAIHRASARAPPPPA